MAQLIHSRLVCNGRFQIHAIEGIGRRKPRVIEIEVIKTRERLHGSATWLAKLVRELETHTSPPPARTPNFLADLFASRPRRP